ncbi:RelA/SpoT family protein [Rickettsiales endosymbiont of Stachyamoeba lipophora]|uniref:RelA/SpoT family protein n=1 Tax=Rickettsiales endosymbiont of Stachyamoeba lipophora TaxID=2486578 RepID=UPI000F653693|nr:bifunctional (p)ppGpp synthetase/guanosine-3',5'-bis(diphosphate) 3'-pyrophosphohydrolase [Rickettsiales endosymbiont of Stachyamoeba lipophora]AZL15364.1 bifunctional (p)ppGpp synthetase/guanosine-3',5'-bis(diphosphate) 3'-pyrophosphohydrolase [Rickettsiales endosymbiont of Stachyamoeba lipophora]
MISEQHLNEIDRLVNEVKLTVKDIKEDELRKACEFTIIHHGVQLRDSGEPYYSHPFAVAKIIAEMRLDHASVLTALLHDTIEDTQVTLESLKREFGDNIAKLVDGVTKLTKIEYQSENVRQAENLRKLLVAMSEDIRVLLVKLADRVHNMRTLHHIKSLEKRKRIAKETLEIFAPLAERIGAHKVKTELQDIAFTELHPDVRESIMGRLSFLKENDRPLSEKIVQELQELTKKNHIKAEIAGREKTPCSIWLKMQKKNVNFEQLSDIMAFRIIVEDIAACYQALGIIHACYQMIPGEFKDYISTPKENGYRSIHTIVIGPTMHKIEIQIRSKEMHEIAELGVAAHWLYKQEGHTLKTEGKQFRWIRELLNILQNSTESDEVLESTKMQMYYDQVFCFTPMGQLIALPKGSCTIDFAYAVHSNIGNSCAGAKINGKIAPLSTILNNGDQVEIIANKNHLPSPSWEKFVVTAKARSEIRRFVKNKQRDEYLSLGRAIASKVLKIDNNQLTHKNLASALEVFKRKTVEDLFIGVGEGSITKKELIKAIAPHTSTLKKVKEKLSFWKNLKRSAKTQLDNNIVIRGLIPGMALHYAGCCHPIPGDKIVGIVNTGKGVTLHVVDCEMLESYAHTPERWLDVSWEKEAGLNEGYVARVKAILLNEPGALAILTNTIAKDMANITNLRITNRSTDFFELMLDLSVKGTTHLNNIITSLRAKHVIHSIERMKS